MSFRPRPLLHPVKVAAVFMLTTSPIPIDKNIAYK